MRRIAATVLTLVATLLCSTQVLGMNLPTGTYYFDNTGKNWDKVAMAVGRNNWRSSFPLTRVDGTNIWYVVISTQWDNADGYYFYNGDNNIGGESGDYYVWYNQKDKETRTGKQTSEDNAGKCYYYTSQGNDYINGDWCLIPTSLDKSYIILYNTSPETTYKCSGDGAISAFDGASLGFITEPLPVIGEVRSCTGNPSYATTMHVYMGYKIDSGSENSVSMAPYDEESGTGCMKHQSAGGEYQEKIALPDPGHHTLAVWFFSVNSVWDSNSGSNYVANFSVPGFIASDYSFGSNIKKSSTPIDYTYTFRSFGWTPAKVSLSGDDAITFTDGTKTQRDVTISSDNGSITIRLVPSRKGSYKSTLTLKGTLNGKDYIKKVTISAVVPPDNATEVLIGGANVYVGPEAELTGYLKYNGCDNTLLKRGFFFCESPCTPTKASLKAEIAGTTTLNAKDTFTKRFSEAEDGTELKSETTYNYISYVYSEANSGYILSSDDPKAPDTGIGTFTTPAPCRYDIKDTVYYTLDNTQDPNPCELRFQTMADIRSDMEEEHLDLNGDAMDPWLEDGFLKKPIVIEVVKGTVDYGNPDDHTRDVSLMNVNTYDQAYETPDDKPSYRLIVRAKNEKERPKFLGGFDIRHSRYITLKNLIVEYNYKDKSSHEYSALEFGYYGDGAGANHCLPGLFTDTDIEIIGCEIDATGFNCIHAVGCEGLKFDQCVFDMKGAGTAANDRYWGASVKLMGCKNVQFTRNSLKGSHSTLIWLQHTQNVLVMNNVFWNDNLFDSNVTFVRPMMFSPSNASAQEITKLGMYYNTFYLADHAASPYNVDFLRFGGPSDAEGGSQATNSSYYDVANIHFKWNNCYSYDDQISSRNNNATAFLSVKLPSANFAYNNFWSVGDGANKDNPGVKCDMSFPTNQSDNNGTIQVDLFHINVEDLVCKSSATDPDELVLKGSLLNIGAKPSTDISGLGVATDVNSDRFHDVIRSEAGGDWSYGAFQQASIAEIDTIVWVGGKSGAWDDRANWTTTRGKKINCAHAFSSKLHVIIPDAGDLKNVPTIETWSSGRRGSYPDEYVAAGMGVGGKGFAQTSKYANSLSIKEGGAIKGVENLYGDGTLRYTSADNMFTAIRSEWILVGGVIKKFDASTGDPRDIKSGDFYIADHLPHVYMQHFELDENSKIVPGVPFTDLDEKVDANTAFGIYIPDQYGDYKLPADIYYKYISPDESKVGDGTANKKYTFEGRFANEEERPTYHISGTGLANCVFVNNSYPANLNVAKLLDDYSSMGLQAKVYNYEGKGWEDVDASSDEEYAVYVKPNNGFVLYALTSTGDVEPELDHYGNGSTNYLKSASASTILKLKVTNTVDNASSTLSVKYEGVNLPKAFSYNTTTPEIYVPEGSNMYSTYGINDLTEIIPLSVRNQQASGSLTVRFELTRVEGFESVILEDRLNGTTYDLLESPAYCNGIAVGDCSGRFYLNINYAEDEIPTGVEEKTADADGSNGGIDIYGVRGNDVVISSAEGIMLEKAVITDMSGRSSEVKLSDAHYNVISLDGRQGVYIIKAVGDIAGRTEKVIVK